MARRKPKSKKTTPQGNPLRISKTFLAAIADIQTQLHDIDQKLDHLIRNLRRFDGSQYSFDSHLGEPAD